MSGFNKVIIEGNLGADPETRFTAAGTPVSNLRIATNERWKDNNTGETKERTEWHRVVAWGRQAELCSEYLSKGREVLIEGRLQTREWTDRENVKRYMTEIVAQRIVFIGGRANQPKQASKSAEPNAPHEVADIPVADLDDPDFTQEAEDYFKD